MVADSVSVAFLPAFFRSFKRASCRRVYLTSLPILVETAYRFRILSKWIVTRVITPISGLYVP